MSRTGEGAQLITEETDLLHLLAESFAVNAERPCLSALGSDASEPTVSAGSHWTYGQIASAVGAGVRLLVDQGVCPGDAVAVTADRGVDTVVALLAILFSGAVPVPVDARVAQVRATQLIRSLSAVATVTDTDTPFAATGRHLPVSAFTPGDGGSAEPLAQFEERFRRQPTCCVLHTSGSTGIPKPVELTKRALVSRIIAGQQLYPITEVDVVAHHATPGFDFAWWEIFAPLAAGALIAVAPAVVEADPAALNAWIQRARPNVLHFIPSLFAELLAAVGSAGCRAALDQVRLLFFGGERLTPALLGAARQAVPGRIFNQYGPTEAAIDVAAWEDNGVDLSALTDVPVGTPFPRIAWCLYDPDAAPVPAGEVGELLLGGPQLTWGYRGRPGDTAQAFVPVEDGPGGLDRMYRTGDLMWACDDVLHYVGRRDDELKIRGIRLSIGEIENMLAQYGEVDASVVLLGGAEAAPVLICHYVAAGEDPGPAAIRDYLSARLPGAAVPSAFHRHDNLPRLANSKIDRQRLAELVTAAPPSSVRADSLARTDSDADSALAEMQTLWREVLKVKALGPDDDFFAAGGHSLLAMRVIARVRRQTSRRVAVRTIYQNPTPRSFQAALDGSAATPASAAPGDHDSRRPRRETEQ